MDVASAAIISDLVAAASVFISPMRIATGALVSVKIAPCSCAFSATFQAMEAELSAPVMMPRLPFNKLFDIGVFYKSWQIYNITFLSEFSCEIVDSIGRYYKFRVAWR